MRIKKILAAIIAAAAAAALGVPAFAEDYDDDELEAEEVSIYDEIRRGEGYYECHIVYHEGIPQIYSEDGDIYDTIGTIGGNLREGETKESVKKDAEEQVREQFVSMGADPGDHGFEVYVYFFDDYDYTPEEFLNFIPEDIARRENERLNGSDEAETEEVPNPVTGNAFPYLSCGAAVCAAALACGIGKKNKT